jgi:DNA topoisomerase-1
MITANKSLPTTSHKEHLAVVKDYEAAARLANLVYVACNEQGITRQRAGKGFCYKLNDKLVKDKETLKRIKALVIPPAWEEVWICTVNNGHIQATGLDVKNRKQYRYHPLWNLLRNETKFHKMISFGKVLPTLRRQVEKDIAFRELCEQKVLATVISLMERTYIRIGNSSYEKMNGSHGLTTLKDKHVSITGSSIAFSFKGKKNIAHSIQLRNRRLAYIVKQCRDILGKELFQYYDDDGKRQCIDSGMVNHYIQSITGEKFTAKDFRTWAGCLHFLLAFKNIALNMGEEAKAPTVNQLLDEVSEKLGNTRTVCRKYYVHPGIIRLYEEQQLSSYIKQLDKIEEPDDAASLTTEEKVLMKLLKKIS